MFKISVRFWQSCLKLDKALFAGVAIATAKTDGYSFAFWFKLTEALPTAKK